MATIALKGAFGFGTDIKAFNSLDSSFSRLKTTTSGLTNALGELITKIDTADKAVDKDCCCTAAERSKARESDKKTSMSLAYDKLDELMRRKTNAPL